MSSLATDALATRLELNTPRVASAAIDAAASLTSAQTPATKPKKRRVMLAIRWLHGTPPDLFRVREVSKDTKTRLQELKRKGSIHNYQIFDLRDVGGETELEHFLQEFDFDNEESPDDDEESSDDDEDKAARPSQKPPSAHCSKTTVGAKPAVASSNANA